MAIKKPNLVFAHGGWHNPSCFDTIRQSLENAGFTCHIPQLPSSGPNAVSMTLRDDAKLLHNIIKDSLDAGNDVLVLGHSNGGFTACGALAGLVGEEAASRPGKVLGIAMIAAFIPPALEKGAFKDVPPLDTSWFRFNEHEPTFTPSSPNRLFYNDLPSSQQDYWTSRIQPMHLPEFHGFYEPWRYGVPISYLLCEDDVAQPPAVQEAMIKACRAEGGRVIVERVKSGHSPFLSMPETVVGWIERSVEAFGGKPD